MVELREVSRPYNIDLDQVTGMLVPFRDDPLPAHPVAFMLDGSPFVPVFRTEKKLHVFMSLVRQGEIYSVKRITNGANFLASLKEQRARVMVDPYFQEDGRLRFTELVLTLRVPRLSQA